jgi:hypothetical protein
MVGKRGNEHSQLSREEYHDEALDEARGSGNKASEDNEKFSKASPGTLERRRFVKLPR